MSAFVGWFGSEAQTDPQRAWIDRLASLPSGAERSRPRVASGHRYAIVASNAESMRLHVDEQLAVAIDGSPWWDDEHLMRISREKGPANAIAHGFRERGPAILARTRGAFALAVVDLRADGLLLAVDWMGTRPLAYALTDDGIVFGSSAQLVRGHPSVNTAVDAQAIYDYFYFNMIPSPRTIYRGIRKLEPAQYLHYRNRAADTHLYWQPVFDDKGGPGFDELAHELRDTLRRAVKRSLSDGISTGVFLSGGVDSSTVCGVSAELSPVPVGTYSIGFDAPGYDEMTYARIAARHFRTDAHEYYVTPRDVADTIPLIARLYDEPFGNSSALPVYHCARVARANGVDRMLAGDGGDELFGGNARYAKQKVFEAYGAIPGPVRALLEPVVLGIPGADRVPVLAKARSYIRQAKIPLPDRLETYNPLHRASPQAVFDGEFLRHADPTEPLANQRAVYRRVDTRSAVNRMLYLDWKLTLADNDLRKVNRMCEAAGVQVGYPMLDNDLVEFSTRVPAALKVKGLQLRYFFKRALRGFLPDEVIAKRKHGFGLPFGLWLRTSDDLKELVYPSLARLKQRGYIRPDYIDQTIAAHRDEHAAFYGNAIWVLMMLDLWLEAHAVQGPRHEAW